MKHEQTIYILEFVDQNRKPFMYQYAPSVIKESRLDIVGTYMVEPTHEFEKGDLVNCLEVELIGSKLQAPKETQCIVLSKRRYMWDMSKPFDSRMELIYQDGNFEEFYNEIRHNRKILSN